MKSKNVFLIVAMLVLIVLAMSLLSANADSDAGYRTFLPSVVSFPDSYPYQPSRTPVPVPPWDPTNTPVPVG